MSSRAASSLPARTISARPKCFWPPRNRRTCTGWVSLNLANGALAKEHPAWLLWGGGEPGLGPLFAADSHPPKSGPEPFTEFIIRLENRQRALDSLRASGQSGVAELLRFRAQTNTVLFPPSASASGQALDAALAICGLLMEQGRLNASFSNLVVGLASQANHGLNSQPFEQVLMDLMTLGQQFNWNQLAVFVGRIEDAETLRHLAAEAHDSGAQLPILFSAVEISGHPKLVAQHLLDFSETGLKDLGTSLQYGQGGLDELLRRNQRLYVSEARQRVAGIAPLGGIYAAGPGLLLACSGVCDYSQVAVVFGSRISAGHGGAFCPAGGARNWNGRCRCAGSICSANFCLRWVSCWWCCC